MIPGAVPICDGGASSALGAANRLTSDRVTGYSESAAFGDCRVEMEKCTTIEGCAKNVLHTAHHG